jgi:hypothetical protein
MPCSFQNTATTEGGIGRFLYHRQITGIDKAKTEIKKNTRNYFHLPAKWIVNSPNNTMLQFFGNTKRSN